MIDLTPVLQALAALTGTVITALIIPLLSGRVGDARLKRLRIWAKIAVKAAEQLFPGPGKGAAKKAYVIAFLNAHGFTLDAPALNALIECEVNTQCAVDASLRPRCLTCKYEMEAQKCPF